MRRLDEYRAASSAEERSKAIQALKDLRSRVTSMSDALDAAEDRLRNLSMVSAAQGTSEKVMDLLLRADQIRDVSRSRAEWCKVRTKYEQAMWSVDKVDVMRELWRAEDGI